MDNGHDGKLAEMFCGLELNDSCRSSDNDVRNDSLFQVIKAVEAAEATIKQQVEENNRLKSELQRKILELEKYKPDESFSRRSNLEDQSNTTTHGSYMGQQSAAVGNPVDRLKNMSSASNADSSGTLVVHQHLQSNGEEATVSNRAENHSEGFMINGTTRGAIGGAEPSQFSSPSTGSLSRIRPQLEREHDTLFNVSTHGLMRVGELNNSSNELKQELIHKVREQEQEILQLRKYLADYSIKEAQIRNEKYILEKRIAYMRLAFDQQQQDLVDAASKALSYRQEIIEENIRLTYALQAAQQERSTFLSYLLPLLSEYSLQPQLSDAQSIVSNVKVLFRHLQEKLLLTETNLKESEYQLAPWRSDLNHPNAARLSPLHPDGAGLSPSMEDALNIVSQPPYSHVQTMRNWDSERRHQEGLDDSTIGNYQAHGPGRYSHLVSSRTAAHEMPVQSGLSQHEFHGLKQGEENTPKQVKFREPLRNPGMEAADTEGHADTKETSANWSYDDPSSTNSPHLAPVLEEPSSSFSEAADDDPLPEIEGLQITGEAFPGHELQASGYSINGTTSCNFEWVRHMEDGSVKYIDGAKQPSYLVTADDVDTYLAIQVQPLDDRKRKGELVRVFANENRKITCQLEMQNHIEKTLHNGYASYKVSAATGYLDIWEAASLTIKREGYSIKCNSGLAVTDKFSPSTSVTIPYGQPSEFVIVGADGGEHLLRVDSTSTEIENSRDTIVITLRLFILRAVERRKGKRKGFLFTK